MSNVTNMVEVIRSLQPSQIVRNDSVRQQFINVYNAVWKEGGEQVYEREANFFNKILRDNQNLKGCTSLSVFFAFIDLAVQSISVEPGPRAMAYLLPRNYKLVGSDGREYYEKRCNLTISGQGELYLRARAGQIHHADNPVIVYEGDDFEFGERDGRKFVNYTMKMPRTSNKIVAAFMKITRCDGSADYAVMVEQDWRRLLDYSGKNNAYYDKEKRQRVERPNELYTSVNGGIDPGFLASKCIKHAFKSYPKLNIGKGSVLETQAIDEPQHDFDPYAGVTENPNAIPVADGQPAEPQPTPQQLFDSFAAPADTSTGVRIDPSADTNAASAGDDVW